jgi:putative adhesin
MDQTFETPGVVQLVIQLGAGDIVVRASDRTTSRVRVSGYAKEELPRVTCDPTPEGGHRVTIEHRVKKTWGFRFSRGVTVEVDVPNGARLDGSSGAADVEAIGTYGSIHIRTGSGEVRFDDVTGDVEIACASGDVDGRDVGGHLLFRGASGDVNVSSVGNGVTVRSASGDIEIGRLDGTGTIVIGSGDIELRDVGPGRLNVRAISGDVDVAVRQGLGVWLDVSSTSGDVESSLEAAERDAGGEDPELDLTVSTVAGDVQIRRSGGRG